MSISNLKDRLGSKVQNLQNSQDYPNPPNHISEEAVTAASFTDGAVTPAAASTDDSATIPTIYPMIDAHQTSNTNSAVDTYPTAGANQLTPLKSNYIALKSNALDIIRTNLKNQPLSRASIDTIKAPSGGTVAFTVPGISGDEVQKELVGVILDYTTPRAYWETSDPVEGTPPTCYSLDSQLSHEGKLCSKCEFDEFGSKDNGDSPAKACKESIEIFLLRPDNIMPIVVRVPVSSKTIFQRYMTRLVSNMLPVCGVVTKITLEKATSKAGQPYAKFIFEADNTLTPEEISGIKNFSQGIMEVLTAAAERDLKRVG